MTSRILFTLLVLAVIALALWGMRRAWLAKGKKFAHLPMPATNIPTDAIAKTDFYQARFAGSTVSGSWLDRITVHGLGTVRSVTVAAFDSGVFVTDGGNFNLWLPLGQISSVRTSRGIAGDVVEPEGMIIFTWQLGGVAIDTGIRVTRHQDHEVFLTAVAQALNGVAK